MSKKIGLYSSVVNLSSVICFALSMLFGFDSGSYFFSMFIAFSFVPMVCGYAHFSEKKNKLAGYISVAFAAIYAVHGVFFISCLFFPMLGVFEADSPAWIGVAVLEFWCIYFCPIGILSCLHFINLRE